MNIRISKIIIIFFIFFSAKQAYCIFSHSYTFLQPDNPQRSKVYIGLCVGLTNYYGDLDNNNLNVPFYRRYGIQIIMERKISKSFRLSGGFFSGNIFGEERTMQRNLNFKTHLLAPQIGVSYKIFDFYQRRFSAFFFAGIETIFFSPSGNLKNSKGETYYYWDDGTVRNLPEIPSNLSSASIISPDSYYETDYHNLNIDNVSDYPSSALAVPLGLSLEANLNNGFALRIGTLYHYTFTDYLDNITVNSIGSRKGNSSTDKFLFSYAGIIYNLPVTKVKRPSPNDCSFSNKHRSHKKSGRPKLK